MSKENWERHGVWSGRFEKKIDPLALDFTQSVSFDKNLYYYDILGSLAHAKMLHRVGILTARELKKINKGLQSIIRDLQSGKLEFKEELEDVHRNIETALMARIGATGGKLHTARSRNDQVALDFRLYCRDRISELHDSLVRLEQVLVKKGRDFIDVIMPGYTHLQRAQPILFSHHLLAYVEMLERDRARFLDAFRRVNILPLGSGALAGTTFPIDREFVARELGFADVSHNSLDAVSDRDFAVEIAAAGSILMMHLSRLSEELILWSSSEFDFLKLPESFCTGSSMMPQKMNPDVPELVRGKTGRVYGHLISLLTMLKGLPLAYNKDMQEDKEPLFDLFETVVNSVDILAALLKGIRPNRKRMEEAAGDGFLLATDFADWLVKGGLDFRSSHELTARIVRHALEKGKDLKELTLPELRKFSHRFTSDLFSALKTKAAIENRRATGGTARANVLREIKRLEKRLVGA
jgi:argininosuccinate lyase